MSRLRDKSSAHSRATRMGNGQFGAHMRHLAVVPPRLYGGGGQRAALTNDSPFHPRLGLDEGVFG